MIARKNVVEHRQAGRRADFSRVEQGREVDKPNNTLQGDGGPAGTSAQQPGSRLARRA